MPTQLEKAMLWVISACIIDTFLFGILLDFRGKYPKLMKLSKVLGWIAFGLFIMYLWLKVGHFIVTLGGQQ